MRTSYLQMYTAHSNEQVVFLECEQIQNRYVSISCLMMLRLTRPVPRWPLVMFKFKVAMGHDFTPAIFIDYMRRDSHKNDLFPSFHRNNACRLLQSSNQTLLVPVNRMSQCRHDESVATDPVQFLRCPMASADEWTKIKLSNP